MPITRKRKAQSPEESKQTISTASQKSISHYGRVTKCQKVDKSTKKTKTMLDEAIKIASAQEIAQNYSQTEQNPHQSITTIEAPVGVNEQHITRTSRKRRNEETVETPQQKRFKNALPISPAETPSKAAVHLFDKLSIETGKIPARNQASYDTPPLTPRSFADLSESQNIQQLPPPLQDVVHMFSAFITSTSLFYAHNGSGSPLQLAFVLQNVTKTWKKRAVTEIDIRRLLGVLGDSNFEIVDNGDGMVCLEQVGSTAPGHFNQPVQRARFEAQLTKLWRNWISKPANKQREMPEFLHQLPLAEIHQGDFALSARAKPSKGQDRLDDLKKGAVQARSEEKASQRPVVAAEAKTSTGVASRGSSLLDRILAKQSLISSQGSGPTQEEIDRKIALNRIEDIIPVIDVLAGSRPRVSFSTQTMVSYLQNSLRNPISREEAERCLELMASEVTPGFITMFRSGQVKGIVITRAGRPSNQEVRLRLERAGA